LVIRSRLLDTFWPFEAGDEEHPLWSVAAAVTRASRQTTERNSFMRILREG
jgi:hypothetical protein